jgi:hypothetical protein
MNSSGSDAAATSTTAVRILVGAVASAAIGSFLVSAGPAWDEVSERPATFAGFLAVTVALQLMAVRIRDRGAISVAGIAFLATGFTFGVGAAILSALVAALVHALRSRPPLHRAIFNAGSFSLAAGTASSLYHLLETAESTTAEQVVIAFVSGCVFALLNVGLLSLAMSFSEGRGILDVWHERLRWLTPHYLAFGVLAVAATLAYEDFGFLALLAFAAPPAALVVRGALPRRLRSAA